MIIDNTFAYSMFDRYPLNIHNIKQLHTHTKDKEKKETKID